MAEISNRYNLIGRQIPFFLNNINLTDSFYLYQVFTPGVDDNYNPYVSITKTVEKSKNNTTSKGKDIDLISSIIYPKNLVDPVAYVSEMLKKEGVEIVPGEKDGDFPVIHTLSGNNPQKALIIGLRNNLRWKNYRLFPGRYVDILWTPTKYVVCKIMENEKYIWLEPQGVYKNTDLMQQNPLDIHLTTRELNVRVEKSPKVVNDLMYSIRGLEWTSFDRSDR